MKDTLIDSFFDVVERFPEKPALLYRANHHFEILSYESLYKYAEKIGCFFREVGVKEGDRVVLISENRPEWVITDLGTLLVGGILVPVHQVLSVYQIEMILDEVRPKIIVVSSPEILGKIKELNRKEKILYCEGISGADKMVKSGQLYSFKKEVFEREYQKQFEPVIHKPERIVTVIYTSGTTGRFKGVVLTNRNFISNVEDVLTMVEVTENDKFLSILPLSHVFERTVGYYIPLLRGATISYIEDPTKLSEVAQAEKPTIIIAVPRLFEKVYAKVKEKAEASPVKKIIFRWAFKVGRKSSKKNWKYKLANKLVFTKIKEAFGGNIRFFVSGSASLAQEVGEFFDALDIPVIEGYGLTETSPILSCNTLKKRKYGTVGILLPRVKAKVVKGELLVKGPNVFAHYYKNPEKTVEAFTKDGWFKTGDLVEVDKDGFVTILAREKEILALTTGKKVAPAHLEEHIELLPSVAQAFVFGDGRKHVAALLIPDKEKTKGLTKEQKMIQIQGEIDEEVNPKFASYEKIKKFVLIGEPFTVENGLLTPSFKLRRKEIELEYIKEIESLYKE